MVSREEINNEILIPCHVLTRPVEKRKIFAIEDDCLRFVFYMYIANIGKPGLNLHRRDIPKAAKALLRGEEIPKRLVTVEHEPLVNILSFALVINHNHFILSSNIKKGISIYMQKLNTGFAKYFNLKYERQGTLFSRPFKMIPIQGDLQLDAVVRYINIKNPLDVYQPNWKEEGLKNKQEVLWFLNNYEFSSFPDLFGQRKSKILASESALESLGITQNKEEYINFIDDYLNRKMTSHYPLFLEE